MRFGLEYLEARQGQRLPGQPLREALYLSLAVLRRRVAEGRQLVPAAQLDLAQLRVIECVPRDVALASEFLVAPAQQLQVILGRMVAIPVNEVVLLDAGFLGRRPDLDCPEKLAEVFIDPVEAAGDHLLRVIAEVVEDGNVRVTGELLALYAELLVQPQVLGGHLVISERRERAQYHAAVRVKADARADVPARGEELDHRAHFRLRRRERPCAKLLEFLSPRGRKIPIEVETLAIAVDTHLDAIKVVERALGKDAPIGAAAFRRVARNHQARVLGMRFPAAVRVGQPHHQHAAVAVDVLHAQALDRFLIVGIGARGRADEARLVGEGEFGTVRVDARADIEDRRVEQAGDVVALAVLLGEEMQVMQAGGRGRQLSCVDVAVDPERRLVLRLSPCHARRRDYPDVASFPALADAFQREQVRLALAVALENGRELGVAIEAVEGLVHGMEV